MQPARLNITGQKAGSRFVKGMTLCDDAGVAADLSGYIALLRVQRVGTFGPALEASSTNGGILMLPVTPEQPYNLIVDFTVALKAGQYTYDLVLITVDNKHWPILTGEFEVEASAV